jgi:4-aminobutyrate aminotransferase/(S)-3-amino-2-methylpropionate transaminase
VAAAGGGVLVDVDGNSLIDLASGIAVVSVGNAAPEVVRRVLEQAAAFTHTCFMVTPYEGYVEVCEMLARVTPGRHAKKVGAVQLRRGGGGERGQDRAPRRPGAAESRSSTTPYHGRTNLTMAMTGQEHAVQGRLRPVRR